MPDMSYLPPLCLPTLQPRPRYQSAGLHPALSLLRSEASAVPSRDRKVRLGFSICSLGCTGGRVETDRLSRGLRSLRSWLRGYAPWESFTIWVYHGRAWVYHGRARGSQAFAGGGSVIRVLSLCARAVNPCGQAPRKIFYKNLEVLEAFAHSPAD